MGNRFWRRSTSCCCSDRLFLFVPLPPPSFLLLARPSASCLCPHLLCRTVCGQTGLCNKERHCQINHGAIQIGRLLRRRPRRRRRAVLDGRPLCLGAAAAASVIVPIGVPFEWGVSHRACSQHMHLGRVRLRTTAVGALGPQRDVNGGLGGRCKVVNEAPREPAAFRLTLAIKTQTHAIHKHTHTHIPCTHTCHAQYTTYRHRDHDCPPHRHPAGDRGRYPRRGAHPPRHVQGGALRAQPGGRDPILVSQT